MSRGHFSGGLLSGTLYSEHKQQNIPLSESERNPDLPYREVAFQH